MQDLIAFVGHYGEDLDARFTSKDLYTGKSLFKAQGPVWHQGDRQTERIPGNLRHLRCERAGAVPVGEHQAAFTSCCPGQRGLQSCSADRSASWSTSLTRST